MNDTRSSADFDVILGGKETPHRGILFSLLGHGLVGLGLIWVKGFVPSGAPTIIAAGLGDGGSGGAIEVGVVGASAWLRLYPEFEVATLGDNPTAPPAVEDLTHQAETAYEETAVPIPGLKSKTEKPAPSVSKATDRPVARSPDKPYAPDKPSGETANTTALVGIPGSPFPGDVRGGIGIGVGSGGPAGIPGGSEYGRRLQNALIGYYRLTPTDLSNPKYVIVRIQIERSGRVLSLDNGRLRPDAFVQKSGKIVIDSRVTGALLELDRRPIPFPPGFLPGVQEAGVEIYFQYWEE